MKRLKTQNFWDRTHGPNLQFHTSIDKKKWSLKSMITGNKVRNCLQEHWRDNIAVNHKLPCTKTNNIRGKPDDVLAIISNFLWCCCPKAVLQLFTPHIKLPLLEQCVTSRLASISSQNMFCCKEKRAGTNKYLNNQKSRWRDHIGQWSFSF